MNVEIALKKNLPSDHNRHSAKSSLDALASFLQAAPDTGSDSSFCIRRIYKYS